MKKQILLILSLILGLTVTSFAQAKRTLTNADLEKFRQTREQAEREYRDTYQQRGLPSPEELAKQEAARETQLAADANRARANRQREYELTLRAEEVQAQRDLANAQINYLRSQTAYPTNQSSVFVGGQVYTPSGYGSGISYGSYGYGGGISYGGYYGNYQRRGYRQNVQLPPNQQIVRNAANSFPTANEIRNQIYGTPPQQIRGGFGRRH